MSPAEKSRINRILYATREDVRDGICPDEALHLIDLVVNGGAYALPIYDCLPSEEDLPRLPRSYRGLR